MSDFDKEAEREKLREKYERDEEKRQVTRQMSELLLKGATMTNRHCDTCGNPIFRHDGQEFCPTCSGQAAQGAANVPQQQTEVDTAKKSLDVESPDAGPEGADSQAQPQPDGTAEQAPTTPAQSSQRQPGTSPQQQSQQQGTAGTGRLAGQSAQALQQALVSAAQQAAAADDPRQAKEWLAAAREAAEALATLSGR